MDTDYRKVIIGLACCSKGSVGCQYDCPYKNDLECRTTLISDARELLKEQNEIIERLEHDLAITQGVLSGMSKRKDPPWLVRCEDCEHRPTYPEAYGAEINGRWCYWCELLRRWAPDDWFCANGKRRQSENDD